MMHDPIARFKKWWEHALSNSPLKQKSAVCVSTIDADGFPTGRFVDLKAVDASGFTFCTYLDSNKGDDIRRNPKVALTIWWDHVGYQLRVVGTASQLNDTLALEYWDTRTRDAQITTSCFEQSSALEAESHLLLKFEKTKAAFSQSPIPKPASWGGYLVAPVSIEFLTFKQSRLHLRELYEVDGDGWKKSLLQP